MSESTARPLVGPSSPAPAGTSVRAESAETRERILDAAEVLFAEQGFAATSMRDLAARADLTAASLYNHFAGKEDLYEAVLARGVQPLIERLGELAGRDPDTETGERIIRGVMAHLAERPHLPRLVVAEAATGGAHLTRLARQWIRPLIERGRAAMDRESDADRSPFTADEVPFAITSWLHLIFGHFALAPLMREVLDRDPLSAESLDHETRFLVKLARLIAAAAPPADPTLPRSPR
jgi:AcrR family transcriptional regulator